MLAGPILPVFAVMALGLIFGKMGQFSEQMARNLNSFVCYIAQLALIFLLPSNAPFSDYDLSAPLTEHPLILAKSLRVWR